MFARNFLRKYLAKNIFKNSIITVLNWKINRLCISNTAWRLVFDIHPNYAQ